VKALTDKQKAKVRALVEQVSWIPDPFDGAELKNQRKEYTARVRLLDKLIAIVAKPARKAKAKPAEAPATP
jgi:hypothetical protein